MSLSDRVPMRQPFCREAGSPRVPMRCPYCGSVVEPARDTSGALFCPACQNTGKVTPAWPPQPQGSSPPAVPGGMATPAGTAASAPPGRTPGKAVAALVVGIATFVLFPLAIVLGPIALVLGIKALGEVKRSPPGTPGQGMAIAGTVLGGLGILLGLTVLMAAVVFVLVSNLSEPPEPTFTFEVDAEGTGGVLRLSNVTDLPSFADWSDYELGGTARCALPNGDIDVGDEIVCVTDGTVVLIDWYDEETVYFADV